MGGNVEVAFGAPYQTYFCWWEHLQVLPVQVSDLSPSLGVTQRFLLQEALDSSEERLRPVSV